MQLLSVTIENFGVFHGSHELILKPIDGEDRGLRNVTIITGHNGSGKSTLFQAIQIALLGPLALGPKITKKRYLEFIAARLHRKYASGTPTVCSSGSIRLNVVFQHSGEFLYTNIKRTFQITENKLQESLSIVCNGQILNIDPSSYQSWLLDLVPAGLLQLCFFDSDLFDTLAHFDKQHKQLQTVLKHVFGLDLVDQLISDLDRYTLRNGWNPKWDSYVEEIQKLNSKVNLLEQEITSLETEIERIAEEEDNVRSKILKKESLLAAKGGHYSLKRQDRILRANEIQQEIELVSHKIGNLCNELMPFALAPELCSSLRRTLEIETSLQREKNAEEVLSNKIGDIKRKLDSATFWEGIKLDKGDKIKLRKRINNAINSPRVRSNDYSEVQVHQLSESEREQLEKWISRAIHTVPEEAQYLCETFTELRDEQTKIEQYLSQTPDDETLIPIHEDIKGLNTIAGELRDKQVALVKQVGSVQYQREEVVRQRNGLMKKVEEAQSSNRRLNLANRSKKVLRKYKDKLLGYRLDALENALLESFNHLCRKEHLLEGVLINQEDMQITLYRGDGNILLSDDFSMGEVQLYVLALLWAIRRIGRHDLPLLIDTPIARLDEIHRWRLMHKFLPSVSGQIILFLTDNELNRVTLTHASPYLARVYRLDFDDKSSESRVESLNLTGAEGTILYHPSTTDKYQQENGHIWHANPECADLTNELKRAILPGDAKRLVLASPLTGEYLWPAIIEFQRLINDQNLIEELKNGGILSDLWKDSWNDILREASFDSVALVDSGGPIEFVINPSILRPLEEVPLKRGRVEINV